MNKSEFLERVNSIRLGRGLDAVAYEDVSPQDYSVVEYVYTWHPAFQVADAKTAIAEVYCVQTAAMNGMAIIRSMVQPAKYAQTIEARRSQLRRQIANLEKQLHALNSDMRKIANGQRFFHE